MPTSARKSAGPKPTSSKASKPSAKATAPAGPFAGFRAEAIGFLAGLESNNNKPWFDEHRATWEAAIKAPMAALMDELAIARGGRVKIFRINRDVRFSKDKSPYKPTASGVLLDIPDTFAGYYIELSPQGLFAGAGYHAMETDQMRRFKAALADETKHAGLTKALTALHKKGVSVAGEAYPALPEDYRGGAPYVVEMMKKDLFAGAVLAPTDARLFAADARPFVIATWRAIEPLCLWLDTFIGPSTKPAPAYAR
jgi:uncharacterized protein (TIGR02453 family)